MAETALRGRRVVITRGGETLTDLAAQLRRLGAEPLIAPTIAIAPPADFGPLDAAIGALDRYDGIAFTSANAVRAFRDRLALAGRDLAALAGLRCGAVGLATAAALAEAGREADIVPRRQMAEELVAAFGDVAGRRILFPASDIARPTLPDGLRARGARVDVVIAYRTIPAAPESDAPLVNLLRAGMVDAVTFTSPSTVRGFLDLLPAADLRRASRPPAIVCIGPTTAGAARAAGLPVDAVAAEYSIAGLLAALIAHFSARSPAADPAG